MVKIIVMVSGNGTNLQALIDAQNNGILSSGYIAHVISSREGVYALARARMAGIPATVAKTEDEIFSVIDDVRPDLIVLAGYMKILSSDFLEQLFIPVINIHPSLIPSFCGRGCYGLKVHEAVLKSGAKITGATVHYVNEIPDGGKIIAQKAVEVLHDDTPERLQRRVMERCEWEILPRTVEKLCAEIDPKIFRKPIKYPGRGIIVGMNTSGDKVLAYFITGRSASSRARIFERGDDEEIIIRLTGEKKVFDPSLILYTPIRTNGDNVIVSNGDQTDTIYDALTSGATFEDALRTRKYEPDSPHYTPRISAMLMSSYYKMSILKQAGKYFFEYDYIPGTGRMIYTYNHDVVPGETLPSFEGEPREVYIHDDMEYFASELWNSLAKEYRVALYVRYYDGYTYRDKIYNAQEEYVS